MTYRFHPFLYVIATAIACYLVAPTLIVAVMSFSSAEGLQFPPPGLSTRWYRTFLQSAMWTDAAKTSLEVAAGSALLSTALGTLAALGLVRGRYRGRAFVNAVVLSPLIVPTVVIAIGMYFVFVKWHLAGTLIGLVVAHAALSMPFVILNVGSSLRTLDQNLELAAQSLGGRPAQVFRRITLPLIMPGVITGGLIAFAFSWDEVIVAIFLSTSVVRTLPAVMWGEVQTRLDPTSAAVATILSAMTVLIISLFLLLRRGFVAWSRV